ncbi:MAG: ABC transporter substrate-binding protein, partial [Chloroflexota bacterium]
HSDLFGYAFVKRGGTIVQEIHPPLGTTDFGPYLAQLSSDADVFWAFAPGTDGLRLMEAYSSYASGRKLQVVDSGATLVGGPNLAQEKDKALGVVAVNYYSQAYDSPLNQSLIKAFQQKYPGRFISAEVPQGYAGAQAIEAAVKKVNGNVEDKQPFLNALYGINLDTAKGPIKLDKDHDIVQNIYAYRIEKQGDSYGEKLLDTYKDLTRNWDISAEDQVRFSPFGKLKGKWAGMTKAGLDQVKAG